MRRSGTAAPSAGRSPTPTRPPSCRSRSQRSARASTCGRGAAVLVTLAADGSCERVAIALLAAAPTPLRAPDAETWLEGKRIDAQAADEAAARAVADVRPTGDIHGGAEYRRSLVQ